MFRIDLKIFIQSLYQESKTKTNQRKNFPIFPTTFLYTIPLMSMFDRVGWSNLHLQKLFLLCFSLILSFYASVPDISRLLNFKHLYCFCLVFPLFYLFISSVSAPDRSRQLFRPEPHRARIFPQSTKWIS